MTVTDILSWFYAHFEYPWVLLGLIILVPLVWWLLNKQFIVSKDDAIIKKQKARVRRYMKFSRSLMIILLIIALASPFVQEEKIIEGDPFIQLLVDNSTSMALFEDISSSLAAKLEKHLNTEVRMVGTDTVSNIGDGVLNVVEPHSSVILLSDGNVNSGASLSDVALFASKLNASVNGIKLKAINDDVSVEIFGPSKTLEDSESTFSVFINRVGNVQSVPLTVVLDGETIYDQVTSDNAVKFTKQLSKGTHKIVASVKVNDFFPNNNVFYKTIRVVPKPKVLLLSEKTSPLETFLKQLFVVDVQKKLPEKLSDYYAIVVNDLSASKLDSVTDVLNDFVADGNGLVVFGGESSYDRGDYKNSMFETLLPVKVGSPEKDEGDVLIAIVIDVSGSQGAPFGRFTSTAEFSKSATIDILRNLKLDTRVAIIAFNTHAYVLSEPSPVFSKQGVESLIGRLKWGGGTNVGAGLMKAISVLGEYSGSKNIILLSDGKTQAQANAYEAAKYAANAGIKIYTVGVGPTTDEVVMMDLAEISNGIYFRATEETRLKILFGPIDEQQSETGQMELVVLNKNHFITENFEPKASLFGFNQVSPKSAGRLLATTSTGEPVLTVWRLGLGRVAAMSVDDGSKWAGSLLGVGNSRFVTRTMNWAIGDPERKSLSFIDVTDGRVNEPVEVIVRSEIPPESENVVFYKIDEELYSGTIIPDKVGFKDVAGSVFGVNFESEFQDVGFNRELESIVSTTGGKMFNPDDIDGMVEHAKSRARRVINSRDYVRYPFIILASCLFLLEIFIRRILRNE